MRSTDGISALLAPPKQCSLPLFDPNMKRIQKQSFHLPQHQSAYSLPSLRGMNGMSDVLKSFKYQSPNPVETRVRGYPQLFSHRQDATHAYLIASSSLMLICCRCSIIMWHLKSSRNLRVLKYWLLLVFFALLTTRYRSF